MYLRIKDGCYIYEIRNSKHSESCILILKLTNKLDLRIGEKVITLSNLNIYYT